MKVIPLKKFRLNLSQILGEVKRGEEVVITERGKAIARITPVSPVDELAGMLEGMDIDLKKEREERIGRYTQTDN